MRSLYDELLFLKHTACLIYDDLTTKGCEDSVKETAIKPIRETRDRKVKEVAEGNLSDFIDAIHQLEEDYDCEMHKAAHHRDKACEVKTHIDILKNLLKEDMQSKGQTERVQRSHQVSLQNNKIIIR